MLERNVEDVELADYLCSIIQRITQPGGLQVIRQILVNGDGGGGGVVIVPGTDACPTFIYYPYPGGIFVAINGTESLAQATGLYNGWSGGLLEFPFRADNQYLIDASTIVLNNLPPDLATSDTPLFITGHSLGGAIATLVAARLLARGKIPTPKLVTFGAPRALGTSFWGVLTKNFTCRWFTDADPIPLLPPRVADAPFTSVLLSGQQLNRFGQFRHSPGGLQVSPNAIVTAEELPTVAELSFTTSILNWMWSVEQGINTPHSLTTYRSSFQFFLATFPPNNRRVPEQAGPELVENAARAEVNAAARANEQAIFRVAEQQNAVPTVVPKAAAFDIEHNGRMWSVTFGGQFCCLGPTKKRARAIKNFGNEFLTRLQSAGIVDPTAFIQQLPAYFDAATSPTTGFQPVMNIQWPS